MAISGNDEKDLAIFQAEWKECRDILSTWDERLHDLRKYGFSFITALLTAQVLLLPSSSEGSLPDGMKCVILGATLILTGALHCLDKGYRVFQEATMTRAKVLERRLNVEISETIASRSVWRFLRYTIPFIYALFAGVIFLLGIAILTPTAAEYIAYISVLGIGSVAATVLPLRIVPHFEHGSQDWTISPLQLSSGDTLRVTLTNLKEQEAGPLTIPREERQTVMPMTIFKIVKEGSDGKTPVYEQKLDTPITVHSNYTWILDMAAFGDTTGVYRLIPMTWKIKRPLRRAIFFTKKEVAEDQKKKLIATVSNWVKGQGLESAVNDQKQNELVEQIMRADNP